MTFQLIKSSQIKYWCDKLSCQQNIAIDTEFSRVTTYWPKLALVQLSDGVDTILIDPLDKDIDLSPLDDLLANPDTVKIFHSCRQDLEILYKTFGRLPVMGKDFFKIFLGDSDSRIHNGNTKIFC